MSIKANIKDERRVNEKLFHLDNYLLWDTHLANGWIRWPDSVNSF
jgi:hypothetical protein